jgi:hypothetical protein
MKKIMYRDVVFHILVGMPYESSFQTCLFAVIYVPSLPPHKSLWTGCGGGRLKRRPCDPKEEYKGLSFRAMRTIGIPQGPRFRIDGVE